MKASQICAGLHCFYPGGGMLDLATLIDDMEAARILGRSTRRLRSFMHQPDFPRPVVFGTGRRWRETEIRAWAAANPPRRFASKPGPRPRPVAADAAD